MTAVYKGTKKVGTGQIFLRSYDSRKEPAIEPNATIWQAGRATSATALAFKPIQIGQSVFLDEGTGQYNPAPMVLDEAVCNEWPGREVGVFISIGTGKRPEGTQQQQQLWWEGFVSSGLGDFAEARRRLIGKIEGCERTHLGMKDHLAKRQVNPENYYRLNVSVGVGEFGMNEWNRLADISTSTRMYLAEDAVSRQNIEAAAKLSRIHRAKQRWERVQSASQQRPQSTVSYANPWDRERPHPTIPDPPAMAVELPAEDVDPTLPTHYQHHPAMLRPTTYHGRHPSESSMFNIVSSDEYPQPVTADIRHSMISAPDTRYSGDFGTDNRRSAEQFSTGGVSSVHTGGSPRLSQEEQQAFHNPSNRHSPPPLPPKTPLPALPSGHPGIPPAGTMLVTGARPPPGAPLPYPEEDGPPPVVNRERKPEISR